MYDAIDARVRQTFAKAFGMDHWNEVILPSMPGRKGGGGRNVLLVIA